MDIFKAYQTDTDKEVEGTWVPFPQYEDAEFKLARAGGSNKQWEVERERILRPLRKRYREDSIPDSVLLPALREAFCDKILKGWRNIPDHNGPVDVETGEVPQLADTHENKVMLCTNLPDLYAELLSEAGALENFRSGEVIAEAGK